MRFSGATRKAPAGWVAPRVERTTPGWRRALPGYKRTRADEVTAAFPPGSRVIDVETAGPGRVLVGVMPGGEVVVPEGIRAVVYEKTRPVVGWEVRPWLGGGVAFFADAPAVAAGAGLDVVRLGRVHAGPGVVGSADGVAVVLTAGVTAWSDVDARAGVGTGSAGRTAFVGVTVGWN